MEKPTPRQLPDWLKQLKDLSWQVELFISGGLVFVLLGLPEEIDKLQILFTNFYSITGMAVAFKVVKLAVLWLVIGFLINLIFRAFWTGLIGLSYVFEGVKNDNLKYSELFNKRLSKLDKLDDFILKIESISSIAFSVTFLIFFAFISLVLTFVFGLLMGNIIPDLIIDYLGVVFLISGFIYFIDFITLGIFKKNKIISYIYMPIYLLFSTITLSFLYRNIYYTLITNIKKRYIFAGFAVFVLVNFLIVLVNNDVVGTINQRDNINIVSNSNYENLNIDHRYSDFSIQSDIISDNYVKLFVSNKLLSLWFNDSYFLNQESLKDEYGNKENLLEIRSLFDISIDDSTITNYRWKHYIHPIMKQRGYIAYIEVNKLNIGLHLLRISTKNVDFKTNVFGRYENGYYEIEFYK